jgi:hypothetical protein
MVERVDLCAFLTVVMHECQHHFDIMRTPFGLRIHEIAAREFHAFERLAPYLVNHPKTLAAPLSDWVLSQPPGTPSQDVLRTGSDTRQAEIDLRGTLPYDEFRRGTPPRNVSKGVQKLNMEGLVVRGQLWPLLTVNQLWPTVARRDGRYLSPTDILEGRALAMSLLYLYDLMGPTPTTIATIRAFVEEYYSNTDAGTYTSLLEIHAGRQIAAIWELPPREIRGLCHDVMWSSWFAFHAGVGGHAEDANFNVSMRCLMAASSLYCSSEELGNANVGAIQRVDAALAAGGAPTGLTTIVDAIDRCVLVLTVYVNNIADPIMKEWFGTVLTTIGSELQRRYREGYECLSGTPHDGNSLRAARTDVGANEIMGVAPGGERVARWFEVRRLVVTTMVDADARKSALKEFFAI